MDFAERCDGKQGRGFWKFLGHSDIQVTLKIYTHLSEGKEQAAVDALNKHLGA